MMGALGSGNDGKVLRGLRIVTVEAEGGDRERRELCFSFLFLLCDELTWV